MPNLYSLYDALVSINVPNDRALAVVDAMERDMVTLLATKQDLQAFATKADILELRRELQALPTKQGLDAFATKQDLLALEGRINQKFELFRSEMTVRFGRMLFLATGLLFAALKLV